MIKMNHKGQTVLEYVLIFIIVAGALLAMQNYILRGVQGQWKASTDDLGEQYDPRTADTSIRHSIDSTTVTELRALKELDAEGEVIGLTTFRTDTTNSTDFKTGTMRSGEY